MDGARFDASGGVVVVTLNGPAAVAVDGARWPCDDALELAGSGGATCAWESATRLAATLGPGATVRPGDGVALRAGAVRGAGALACSPSNGRSAATIAGPVAAVAPRAVLTPAVSTVVACEGLTLDVSASTGHGGRAWTSVAWTVDAAALGARAAAAAGSATLAFSPADLEAIVGATVTVTVALENFLGGAATKALAFAVAASPRPSVAVAGGDDVRVLAADGLHARSEAAASGCGAAAGDAGAVTSAWRVVAYVDEAGAALPFPVDVSANARDFILEPYALQPGSRLDLAVTATRGTATNEAAATVTVGRARPVARIAGGTARTASAGDAADAAGSYDPDVAPGDRAADDLTFAWTCADDTGAAVPLADASSPVVALPTAPGVYRLSVVVEKDGRASDAAVQVVTVAADVAPVVAIDDFEGPLAPARKNRLTARVDGVDGATVYYVWTLAPYAVPSSVVAASVDGGSADATLVVGDPLRPLAAGATYVFTLTATIDGGPHAGNAAAASIAVVANRPPHGGRLAVTPATGEAATTRFALEAGGWTDVDLPLVYAFSTASRLLAEGLADGRAQNLLLPPGPAVALATTVADAHGAAATAATTAAVAEAGATVAALRASSDADLDATVASGEVEEAYAALVAYSGAVEAGAAPLGGACGGRGDRVEAASGAASCACDDGFHGPTCAYDDAAWAERTAYAASLLGHRDAVAALQPPSDAATRMQASSLAAIASTAALDEAASAAVLESARALAADAAARGVDDEAFAKDVADALAAAVAAAPPPRSGDGRRLQASSSLDDVAAALSSVCEALLNNAAADERPTGAANDVIDVRCSKLSPATAPGALVNASAGALALPASTDLDDGEWLEAFAYVVDAAGAYAPSTATRSRDGDKSTTIIVDVRSRTLSFGFATDSPDGRRRLRRGGFSSGGGGATLSFDDDVDGPAGLSETLYAVNVTCAGEDIVVACDGGGDDVTVPCGPDNEGTVYEATCVRRVEPGCAEYDVAAGAWVAVCAATSSAGATVCECSPEQVALWAAYDGSTAVASTTNAVFTSYYAELFAEGLTDAVWTRTTLLLYTLAALVGATVLLGVWGWDKDRRCRADATRKALDAFVDSKAKFRGSRSVSEKVSLSSIPLEVHDGLLEASMPNFMAKVHKPGSLVWDKIKQYHCILSVVFYYDPRFSRLTRAFLALFDVVVILFAEAVTYELVFPAGVCESLEDLGDAASCENLRSPVFRDTKICIWDAFVDPRCRLKQPGSGAYDNLVRITMVALSIAVCLPALKLAAFATRRYLARDHVWAWRPDAGGRGDDEVLFDDACARDDGPLFAALHRVLRRGDDRATRARSRTQKAAKLKRGARASAHETFDFRAALDNADVSRFERQVLRALPGTMRAVVRQRVELNDALLDLKTGRHPGMSVTERRALASNLGFLKHRLELLWGISSTGSAGWEYVFASTAYRVLSHAIKEAIAFDRDLQQVEDPATKCLLIYHFCRYENLNDDERRVLRQALNTRGTWAEEGYNFREPPVSGYVKVALLVLMVLVLAATAYFLLVFGLGRDEAVQREWWGDTMLTLGLILVIFEPARIAVCHCSVPVLIGNKMEHYRDPVRLRLPYRNAAPSTASELISAQHLAAFEDVGLPVPTVLRVAEKAWATRDDGSDDDDDFVDPLARSNRRRRAADEPEPTRLRRCGAWAATVGHRVVRAVTSRSLDVARFEAEAPTEVETVVWRVAQNAGDLGNPSTVDPHHAAYNRAYRALSPRWAPAYVAQLRAGLEWRPSAAYRSTIASWAAFSLMHDDVQEMVIEEAFMGLVLGASYGVDQGVDYLGEVSSYAAVGLAFLAVLVPLAAALGLWSRRHGARARAAKSARSGDAGLAALDDADSDVELDDDAVLGRRALPPTRVMVCERIGDDRFRRLFHRRSLKRLVRRKLGRASVWDGATATENDGALLLETDGGDQVELVYGPDTRASKKRYGDRACALLLANCRIFDDRSERKLDVAFDCNDDEARDEWADRFDYLLGTAAKGKHATYAAQAKAVQLVARTVVVDPRRFRRDASKVRKWRRTLEAVARDVRRRRGRARRRWAVALEGVAGRIRDRRLEDRGYTSRELAAVPGELRRLSLEAKRANATAILARDGLLRHLAKTVEHIVKRPHLSMADAVDLLLAGNCVRMLLALPGVLRAVLRKKVERKSLEAFLYLSATSRVPLFTSAALEIMAALYLSRGAARDAVDGVLLRVDRGAAWGGPGLGFADLPEKPDAPGFDDVPRYGSLLHLLDGAELDDVRLSALSLCSALVADGSDRADALWRHALLFRAANGVLEAAPEDLAKAETCAPTDPAASAPALCGARDALLEETAAARDDTGARAVLAGQLERFLDVWESRCLDDADDVYALPAGNGERVELLAERAKRRALLVGTEKAEALLASVGDDFAGLVRLLPEGESRAVVSADDDDSSDDDEAKKAPVARVDVTAACLAKYTPNLVYGRVADKKTKAELEAEAEERRLAKLDEKRKNEEAEAYIKEQRLKQAREAAAAAAAAAPPPRPGLLSQESMRAIEVVGAARAEAAVSGDVDGVPPADPALEKFHKMLKMHVPQGAVEAKMRAEGLDPDALKYEKYRSMLKMHVPRGAVEAKMRADGLDPAGLFGAPKAAKAAPKADPATASMKRRFETPLGCARAPRAKLRNLWWDFIDDDAVGFWAEDARKRRGKHPKWLDNAALDDLERVYGDAKAAAKAPSAKEAAAAKQAAEGKKKRSVVAEVLGPRRGLELNILHGSLKVEPETLAALLKHLDAAALADKADVLHGLFESDETVAAMTAAMRPFLVEGADRSKLDAASQTYAAVLGAVARAPAKVHCLRLASRLDGRVDELDASLDTLRDAADEVKRSPAWRAVLEFVLAINNFANDGTPRGWKKALRVSSLRKLKNAKTAPMADLGDAAPGNLLRFVAKHVDVGEALEAELATVRAAALATPLSDLRADVAALEADAAAAAREADALLDDGETTAEARARATADAARRAVDALQDKLAATSSTCALLLRGFGEDPAKVPAEAFFGDVAAFLDDFKREADDVRAALTGGRRPARRRAPRMRAPEEQTFLAGIRHSLKRAGAIRTLAADDSDDEFDAATAVNRRRSMLRRAIAGGGDSDDEGDSESSGFSDGDF